MGHIVLLDLAGGIALLLWGPHMMQSGILQVFGSDLRRLGIALRNRLTAFLAGVGVTALLQSSTEQVQCSKEHASERRRWRGHRIKVALVVTGRR